MKTVDGRREMKAKKKKKVKMAPGISRPFDNQYGCECERIAGKKLCPKHGRS